MFQSFFGVRDFDGAYWTLSIELKFYFFICFLILLKLTSKIFTVCWTVLAFLVLNSLLDLIVIEHLNQFVFFISGIGFFKIYESTQQRNLQAHLLIWCSGISGLLLIYPKPLERLIIVGIYCVFYLFTFGRLRIFNNRGLAFTGMISYSFYLLHENMGVLFFNLLLMLDVQNLALRILITLPIVGILAYASFRLLEQKAKKKLDQRLAA